MATQHEKRQPRFRPRARIITTLGLELISSETVALTELVKNAYDADARYVLIALKPTGATPDAKTASVEVLDDGSGMDSGDLTSTWLEPATPSRRQQPATPSGRRVLGEKGVGRFASAKLGRFLELVSRSPARREVTLSLNWTDFEDPDRFLDEIPISWTERDPETFAAGGPITDRWNRAMAAHLPGDAGVTERPPRSDQGTLLTITSLRGPLTDALVADIRRSLSRLVSPFTGDAAVTSDFKIILDLPEGFGVSSGVVQPPEELKRAHYTLEADVDASGLARVRFALKDGVAKTLDRQLERPGDPAALRCGPFRLKLRVWDRDIESLGELAPSGSSATQMRQMLNAASGISVYRDSFRVLPFGERGDDWLGLDPRRVQAPTRRFSNNQVVGYVLITRDGNPDLVDQTNREGLMETPAYGDLKHAVLELVHLLETERHSARLRKDRKARGGILDPVDLSELRDAISAAAPHDVSLGKLVSNLQQQLDRRTEAVGEVLARYHRLATLGQLIDRVVHEIGQPIVASRQAALVGSEATSSAMKPQLAQECRDLLTRLSGYFATVERQSRVAMDVVRRIEPFGGRRRGRPPEITVEKAIADAVALLHEDIQSAGIAIELPTSSTAVTIDGSELQEVLVNLLTNSIYWLKKVPKSRRSIAFGVQRNPDQSLSIVVDDSGPGVDPKYQEDIFHPYFTTREDGVGLGLTIAGEIVSDFYGGELELLPPVLGGARFRATLRRRVGI